MPTFIVKPKPDEDYYVMWSSVVDAPTYAGTRAEMKRDRPGPESARERFTRADATGTSSVDGIYGWSGDGLIVGNSTPSMGGFRDLKHANIRPYIEAQERGDLPAMLALTLPIGEAQDD